MQRIVIQIDQQHQSIELDNNSNRISASFNLVFKSDQSTNSLSKKKSRGVKVIKY